MSIFPFVGRNAIIAISRLMLGGSAIWQII